MPTTLMPNLQIGGSNVDFSMEGNQRQALLQVIALFSDIKRSRSGGGGDDNYEYDSYIPRRRGGLMKGSMVDSDDDDFRMYEFKVRRCMRGRSHDWTDCPFAHPGEKARRRDPRRVHYSGSPCPDFRKGSCKRGDSCEFSHGVFECWLHPARYRTQVCKDGMNCKRRVCFFAHSPQQLRLHQPAAAGAGADDMVTTAFMATSAPTSPQNTNSVARLYDDTSAMDNMMDNMRHSSSHLASQMRLHIGRQASDMDSLISSLSCSPGHAIWSDPLSRHHVSAATSSSPTSPTLMQPAAVSSPQLDSAALPSPMSSMMPSMPSTQPLASKPVSSFGSSPKVPTMMAQAMSNYSSPVQMMSYPSQDMAASAINSNGSQAMAHSSFTCEGYGECAGSPMMATYRDVAVKRPPIAAHRNLLAGYMEKPSNCNLEHLEAQLASKLKLHTTCELGYGYDFGFPSPTSTLAAHAYSPPPSPLSSANSDKTTEVCHDMAHLDHDIASNRHKMDLHSVCNGQHIQEIGLTRTIGATGPAHFGFSHSLQQSASTPPSIQHKYGNLNTHRLEMQQAFSPPTSRFSLNTSQQSPLLNNIAGGLDRSSTLAYLPLESEQGLALKMRYSGCGGTNTDNLMPNVDWVRDLIS